MAKAANKVISGDYEGYAVGQTMGGGVVLRSLRGSGPKLDKDSVATHESLDSSSSVSASSAAGRAFVGGFLLGPLGLAAGFTAKRNGVHLVAIEFRDGKRSLLEIDASSFKRLTRALF